MPIHDWSRVDAGLFHDFHQSWTVALCDALNASDLSRGYFALLERSSREPLPDALPLVLSAGTKRRDPRPTLLSVAEAPPHASLVQHCDVDVYAARANRITVRHRDGAVVAVIEVVSPGNKGSRVEFNAYLQKLVAFLRHGIHLLLIDLFPPGPRDPQRLHKVIWNEFADEPFDLPADKPLTVVGYDAGPPLAAYINAVAVGEALPDMPLFLKPEVYVPVPLEATYQAAWATRAEAVREVVERGELPSDGGEE